MSISNRKPGERREAPNEPLKRSIAACLRALAQKPDLEVTYATDRPALTGDKARLPEPPRKIAPEDVAIVRGHADSMALRLACHDAAVHRRFAPQAQAARAVFDAVEQARVEAIGARRMEGVAENLSAMIEDRYHRGGKYEEITDRADAPLEDAVALMVRQRLTGRKPPAGRDAHRRPVARLHRGARRHRSRRPARRRSRTSAPSPSGVRELLTSLDMADDARFDRDDEDDEDDGDESEQQEGGEGEAEERADGERAEIDLQDDATDELEEGATEAADAPVRRDARGDGRRRCRRGVARPGVRRPRAQRGARARIQRLHDAVRRGDRRPRSSATPRSSTGCAPISTSSCRTLQGVVARLANRLQRRLLAQQNRSWSFDLEEGMLDTGAPDRASSSTRTTPLSFKQEKDTEFRDTVVTPAARQFRLHARPADHGRGDLRRHPGPHPGALRRQGRDPRLHHPGLEGRAVARGLAAGRQAGPTRAASTTCATSSTSPPTRPGGGPRRTSA